MKPSDRHPNLHSADVLPPWTRIVGIALALLCSSAPALGTKKASTPVAHQARPVGSSASSPTSLEPLEDTLELVEDLVDSGAFQQANSALDLERLDREGNQGVRVRAHTLSGRIQEGSGDAGTAAQRYQRAVDLWSEHASQQWAKSVGSDLRGRRLVARAVDAAGRAVFALGTMRVRQSVEPIRLSAYAGLNAKSPEARRNPSPSELKAFLQARKTAIQEVESVLTKIRAIPPAPPSRWEVAAAAEVCFLWSDLRSQVEGAIPAGGDIETTGQPTQYHNSYPLSATEDLLIKARDACRACSMTSTRQRFFDSNSRRCEQWLGRNTRAEFHDAGDRWLSPTFAGTWLDDNRVPNQRGGEKALP